MDEKTQELIIKWIGDNYDSHFGPCYPGEDSCDDDPYVSSIELEKFILNLGVKS